MPTKTGFGPPSKETPLPEMAARPTLEAFCPSAPTSPTSATCLPSPLNAFLDGPDDVLQWTSQWEQRSNSADQKHIEVLSSHWQLMRESAKEHSHLIHQMKKAMHELRAGGMTLQDRLDLLERKIRDDVARDQRDRLGDLERRLSERLDAEQRRRELEAAELRSLLERGPGESLEEKLRALEARLDDFGKGLSQETEARLRLKKDLEDGDRRLQALLDRCERLDRLTGDAAAKQLAFAGAVRADLIKENEARERDVRLLSEQLRGLQDRLDKDLGKKSDLEALKELVAAERSARLGDLGSLERRLDGSVSDLKARLDKELGKGSDLEALKDVVMNERAARLSALGSLERRLDGAVADLKGLLTEERAERERRCSAVLSSAEDSLLGLQCSIQGRVDHLLRILHEGSAGMVQSWRQRGLPLGAPGA